jgi:hypothetical protein
MDHPAPVMASDGDLHWSDSHSIVSDDEDSHVLTRSPPWAGAISTSSLAAPLLSTASHMRHTGQLSPISTGMDIPGALSHDGRRSIASSASTAPHMEPLSTSSSSCTSSWSIGFDDTDDMSADNDIHWEQGADELLAIPKMEPMDEDDFRLEDVKEAPLTPVASSSAPTPSGPKPKRPRGRPRKHPLAPAAPSNKVTKGRSKTGCITCRKRKKKCDEAKPRCTYLTVHDLVGC